MILTRRLRVAFIHGRSKVKGEEVSSKPEQIVLFMGLVLLMVIMVCVWARLQVVRYGYEISELQKLELQLREENKKLHLEIASLGALDRIEHIAVKELGMIQPNTKNVIFIK